MTAIVTNIKNIQKHTNSDTLVTAEVLGYQIVTREGLYAENDKVIFIPPDQTIPTEMAERMQITNYLKSRADINGDKVLVTTRIKLRGEPSFGLLLRADENDAVDDDVSERLGVYKFAPPVKQMFRDGGFHGLPEHVDFHRFTDVESLRNFPNMFEDGERVIVTTKVHGTNSRVGFVKNESGEAEIFIGSRRLVRERNDGLYSLPLVHLNQMLEHLMQVEDIKSVIVYGELFGKGIQDLEYGRGYVDYVAFDIKIDGAYLHPMDFMVLCDNYDIPTAPTVYVGSYSLNKIRELAEAPNSFGGDHVNEGVVVRSLESQTHPKFGRKIGKYVSDAYLFRKNAEKSDTTDM